MLTSLVDDGGRAVNAGSFRQREQILQKGQPVSIAQESSIELNAGQDGSAEFQARRHQEAYWSGLSPASCARRLGYRDWSYLDVVVASLELLIAPLEYLVEAGLRLVVFKRRLHDGVEEVDNSDAVAGHVGSVVNVGAVTVRLGAADQCVAERFG
jgi:hypothetical protein